MLLGSNESILLELSKNVNKTHLEGWFLVEKCVLFPICIKLFDTPKQYICNKRKENEIQKV